MMDGRKAVAFGDNGQCLKGTQGYVGPRCPARSWEPRYAGVLAWASSYFDEAPGRTRILAGTLLTLLFNTKDSSIPAELLRDELPDLAVN